MRRLRAAMRLFDAPFCDDSAMMVACVRVDRAIAIDAKLMGQLSRGLIGIPDYQAHMTYVCPGFSFVEA